jgi:hypothetical protein
MSTPRMRKGPQWVPASLLQGGLSVGEVELPWGRTPCVRFTYVGLSCPLHMDLGPKRFLVHLQIPYYQVGLMDSYFIERVTMHYYHFLFWCSDLTNGSLFRLSLCLFFLTCSHCSLSTSSLSDTESVPDPAWNHPFLYRALIHFRGIFRRQDFGIRCVCCYWEIFASRFLRQDRSGRYR